MAKPIGRRELLHLGGGLLLGATLPGVLRAKESKGNSGLAAAPESGELNLDLNENPLGPSPLALEEIGRELSMAARYTRNEAARLREQIATREGVSPNQVILGDILAELGSFLGRRSESRGNYVYSVPGYPALVDAARRANAVARKTIRGVALDRDLGNDLAALESAATDQCEAVFFVNPHNPSGTAHSGEQLRNFARAVSARTLLIVDEAYVEFSDAPEDTSLIDLLREGRRIILFRTFDKIHGLAGLPFGYALAPTGLAAEITAEGIGNDHAVGRLAIAGARGALRDVEHLERTRSLVLSERKLWHDFLTASGLRYTASQANFVFFRHTQKTKDLITRLSAKGVHIGKTFPPLEDWARISIGLPEQNRRARQLLAEALEGG